MPYAIADDGVRLYFEETGYGHPLIFVHEFAGDLRSYESQLRHFGKQYRAIAFNARGYPPSDVPKDVSSYSQATSLCIGGCGYGAEPDKREAFRREASLVAETIRKSDMQAFAEKYAYGPTRVQFQNKDPRGFAEFKAWLAEHSAVGSANTQEGVQKERPSLYALVDDMKRIRVPTLIITGDEDWPCLQPALLMKQSIASAALSVLPNTGHAVNIEEPDEYNRIVGHFLNQVDSGHWLSRDPRAISSSITGINT